MMILSLQVAGPDYIHGDVQGEDGDGDTVSYEMSGMGVTVNLDNGPDWDTF